MQLQDYVNVIWRRWWLVALVAFSAAVAAYGFSKTRTPIYRSQAIYSVWVNRYDSGAYMFADKLLNNYVSSVYQPDQLQAISNQLHLDQTGEWLMQYVRLQPQPNAGQIVIEADYFEPGTARQLAAAVGERLNAVVIERNRTAEGQDRVNIARAQQAKDAWKAKPNTKINVLAAGLLGGVLGLLLSFVLEYLDDTLKNAADVERFAGLTTIGAIPASAWDQRRARVRPRPATASGIVARDVRPQARPNEREQL
jgi:capsular polysaccharide biosynthesis protein